MKVSKSGTKIQNEEIKMSRKVLVSLAVLVVLVAVSACAAPTPVAQPVPTVKALRTIGLQLPWRNNGENVVFHVAKKAGFFRDEGLEVNFIEGGPGIPAHVNILSGAQGIEIGAFASDGALIPLLAGDPPLPFVIVGTILQQHPLGFITLESKLTPEQRARDLTPADLKGKTIGVQGEQEILALLQKNGMTRDDVKIVTIAGENPADLLTQRVDYASYWVVNQPLTLKEPWKALMFSKWGVPFYGDVIVTTRERLKKDPEMIKAFMRALNKAMTKVISDPAYAVKASMELGGGYETEEVLKRRIDLQIGMMQSSDTKTHGLGWMDPTRVEQSIKFYVDTKQIKSALKVGDILTTEFLP